MSSDSFDVEDIPFRQIDEQTLLARLYRPAKSADILLVDVHGGAWTQGDRLNNKVIHEHLAARGVTVFALDFRMAPEFRYPAAVQDVNFGIRWAKKHLGRLGLSAQCKVGGLGSSSGGQLLFLNALLPDDGRFATADGSLQGASASLDFLVGCWPILDPWARFNMAKAKGLKNLVDAHHAFWPDEAAMQEGNPYLVVSSGQASAMPPVLVLQGTGDANVEHANADLFVAAYRDKGGAIELEKYEGQEHTFVTKYPDAPASLQAIQRIGDYVVTQGK
jgi:acetyl esterase/lipase